MNVQERVVMFSFLWGMLFGKTFLVGAGGECSRFPTTQRVEARDVATYWEVPRLAPGDKEHSRVKYQ